MRKDYILIPDEQAGVDESAFVEDFWTQRWESVAQLPQAESVTNREEYQIMQPFLQKLPAGSCILDGGCGMGAWTVFLTNQGFKVTGLDISDRTITRLKQFLPNYQFIHGDIRQTNFEDATFDAYFSWGTFEHFENGLGDCIKEAYRILKLGGFLFVSVPFQNWRHILRDAKALHKWDQGYDPQQGFAAPLRFYQWRLTIPEFEQELAMRGFRVLKVQPIGRYEGLSRALVHDFHLTAESLSDRIAKRLLHPIIPTRWIGHMLMAIAQKTDNTL